MSGRLSPPPAAAARPEQLLAEGFARQAAQWARDAGAPAAAVAAVRVAAEALSLAVSEGHVCLALAALPAAFADAAGTRRLDPGDWRAALLASRVVAAPPAPGGRAPAAPMILDDAGRLYLHRYFDYERRLAARLVRAAAAPPDPAALAEATRAQLAALFGRDPAAAGGEADWQQLAAALALRGRLVVVSGGPGTGKTTTVVNLLACLLAQAPQMRIALAAPTGKAAARMTDAIRQRAAHLPPALRERLPTESSTVHRLLGVQPGGRGFLHHAGRPLAIDALVVDEASMLDLALATRLLEAVPAGARIVLLGDKDQLAAVESGAVFAELSADPTLTDACRRDLAAMTGTPPAAIAPPPARAAGALRDAAVWLTRTYRFASDSGIGRLARLVNAGAADEALAWLGQDADADVRWLREAGDDAPPGVAPHGQAGPPALSAPAGPPGLPARPVPPAPPAGAPPAGPVQGELFADADEAPPALPPPAARAPRPTIAAAMAEGYAAYVDAVRALLARPRGEPGRDPAQAAMAAADDPAGAADAGPPAMAADDAAAARAVLAAFDAFRVLCALRDGPRGVEALNAAAARAFRAALGLPGGLPEAAGGSPWFAGRPVLVLANDEVLRLFNGDVGIALPDARGRLLVHFPDAASPDGLRRVAPVRLPRHETAFAMTIHKSQGSEFDAVLVVLPAHRSRLLTRELVYTGLTRARRRVTLAAPAAVLGSAIAGATRRDTGLLARLAEAAGAAPS
jgi:exodeoxyribonuclease V alpha subunit